MVLKNHIAYRFLTDFRFFLELFEEQYPELYNQVFRTVPGKQVLAMDDKEIDKFLPQELKSLFAVAGASRDNRSFVISETVLDSIELLKVDPQPNGHYDWTVFKHLPDQKKTFIFPKNHLIRFVVRDNQIHMIHVAFTFHDKKLGTGKAGWVMTYLDKITGELCHHFDYKDVKEIEEFIYKFLCFFFLSELHEEIIPPGKVHGTKKTGKTLNDFSFPVTIVNSKWNITSIRNEEFGVSGHFRVQPCGEKWSQSKIIFIEPFKKHGYKRRAAKQL